MVLCVTFYFHANMLSIKAFEYCSHRLPKLTSGSFNLIRCEATQVWAHSRLNIRFIPVSCKTSPYLMSHAPHTLHV